MDTGDRFFDRPILDSLCEFASLTPWLSRYVRAHRRYAECGSETIRVWINGIDVFHPNTGEVQSEGPVGHAFRFVDTDYNEESFFIGHAYFLATNGPCKTLKTTLKAGIDPGAWATVDSDTSRPFPRPTSGRFDLKVINHLGDEAMRLFRV